MKKHLSQNSMDGYLDNFFNYLMVEKGLSKNPNADKGYLYLGHIAKFEQNLDKAKKYYTKAVEVNPNCLEASSELRLMSSRDEKKGAGKGAFKR